LSRIFQRIANQRFYLATAAWMLNRAASLHTALVHIDSKLDRVVMAETISPHSDEQCLRDLFEVEQLRSAPKFRGVIGIVAPISKKPARAFLQISVRLSHVSKLQDYVIPRAMV